MKSRVKAGLLLALMYGLGIVTGILWQVHHQPRGHFRHAIAERKLARMKKELRLTAEQEAAIRNIFHAARERAKQVNDEVSWDLDDIHRDSVVAIRKVLTPEQILRFEQIHRRMHERRNRPMEKEETAQEAEAEKQRLREARRRFHERMKEMKAKPETRQEAAPAKEETGK